jgi:hypothetical protein
LLAGVGSLSLPPAFLSPSDADADDDADADAGNLVEL